MYEAILAVLSSSKLFTLANEDMLLQQRKKVFVTGKEFQDSVE